MEELIRVNCLEVFYDKNQIIKNISFSIFKKDFFIIIGPNGSGKSTLLKSLVGLARVKNQKSISICDKNINLYSNKALSKKISFVFQSYPESFGFSVKEVVLLGRAPHLNLLGMISKKDIEIANQAMEYTKVYELRNKNINEISGGEAQRVYIAKAICQSSDIMLLDEPTAALDISHQVKIMDLMEKLKEDKKKTIVMVSHNINLASMYASRLLILKNGKIINCGQPKDVLNYKTLEAVYPCTLLVDDSPIGDFPRVTLVPEKYNVV